MITPVRRSSWVVLALALVAGLPAAAQDEKKDDKKDATITPVKTRGNVFSGEETEFQFKTDKAVKGRMVWRVARGSSTVQSGTAPLNAPFKFAVAEFEKPAIFPTKLTVSVFEDGQTKPVATYEQDLWIFPKDAFADKSEWLKKLKIALYDPKGDTAKVFDKAKVPFE